MAPCASTSAIVSREDSGAGLSTYARRPHRAARQAAHATGGIGCVGFVVLVVVLALGIAYWYISVPVLVLTAIAVGVTVHRQHVHRAAAAAGAATVPIAVDGAAVAGRQTAPPRHARRGRRR